MSLRRHRSVAGRRRRPADFEGPALTTNGTRPGQGRVRRRVLGELRPHAQESRPGLVGVGGHHGLSGIQDGEAVDEPLELADEVGGDQHGPLPGIGVLIGPDHRLDELPADRGIEARGRLVEHQQLGLRGDGPDQGQLRALPLAQAAGGRRRVEPEALQQAFLKIRIPARPEARQVVERLAHTHPRIKGHEVGHVGQAGLHGHFFPYRIQPEDPDGSPLRTQQVQQALEGGGLAGAIAAEEAVAAAPFHRQGQAVDRLGAVVAEAQVADLDRGDAHGSVGLGVRVGRWAGR